ncbi:MULTISPECIES: hypothetical protein [unclassified Lysinibacillus]|uniref:hypothetical protein n=1 Tax=unclassified Lysinibacillus TaxID=2636778 RepID=UPI002012FD30|nr:MULTISPECIES: hypothetical protein [unclassified Lysinibacillus]MCL1696004.1 hypothetical protein [Lysinibacillus sp. BPa_S21]MCL1700645.1 hypothetical protein [Lysinibacillus sp. Bpr_S20]
MNIAVSIVNIQRKLLERTGRKTDVYYSEGQGSLYVFMGEPLTFNNVIYAASEIELMMNLE